MQRAGILFVVRVILVMGLCVAQETAPNKAAVLIESVELIMDGKSSGRVPAGVTVNILGERLESAESLVSFKNDEGATQIGLVPTKALVLTSAAPVAEAAPVSPSAPEPAAAQEMDFSKLQTSPNLARYFKENRTASPILLGTAIKVSGTIDRVDVETVSGGGTKIVVITLAAPTGLPRVKVRLSPSIANGTAIFEAFRKFLPTWWWNYHNRSLEFRLASRTQIQARAVYGTSSQSVSSGGYSSTSRSNTTTQWFSLFNVGDRIALEGAFSGYKMDIELDAGLVISNKG